MTKGKRGGGSKHQLLWEEVPFLKVEKTGKPVAIYKRGGRPEGPSVTATQLLRPLPHPRDQRQADVPSGL